MNVLVTGGGGFLGRYIAEQLIERGDEVTVFSRGHYPALEAIGARTVRGDLQDKEAIGKACKGMDAVYHVAAKSDYWGRWEDFYQPNVIGTQNIIAACQLQQVGRLIYTSTPSVVATNQPRAGKNETLPYPESFESYYPHTKAIAEKLVVEANSSALLTVSLRPHIIFGPRDTQIIPRLINRARQRKLIRIGDGANKIDATFVEDAARAHLLAADRLSPGSPVAGSVYFISQDEPINLWDFVNEIMTRLDIPPVTRSLSLPLARRLGSFMEFSYRTFPLKGEPRLTRFLANELALDHYYDISKAKRELGYRPQYAMVEAIDLTVEYFKNQSTTI
jgi:nucleoside-diphosphate-sugar epimerase